MNKINYKMLSPLTINDFQFQVKSGYKDNFIVFIHNEEKDPKVECTTITVELLNKFLLFKKAESRIPTVVLKPIK